VILTIDIGNTNVAFGGFVDGECTFVARVATDSAQTEDEYASKMLSILSLRGVEREHIDGAIISSVVPQLTTVMKKAVRMICGVEALVVGPGIKTGINIHCDAPSSVGSDLICACVAVNHLYGSPALIVDMGTATKIMVLGDKGTFIGVSIIPGLRMGLRALSEGTAQLPQVSLEAPVSVVGKNTVDAMKSGVVFGHAAMVDGMIDRFDGELGLSLPVYATGGLSQLIVPYCKHDITLNDNLVLKGLELLYIKNR
jgi:type III pantothenate kinase